VSGLGGGNGYYERGDGYDAYEQRFCALSTRYYTTLTILLAHENTYDATTHATHASNHRTVSVMGVTMDGGIGGLSIGKEVGAQVNVPSGRRRMMRQDAREGGDFAGISGPHAPPPPPHSLPVSFYRAHAHLKGAYTRSLMQALLSGRRSRWGTRVIIRVIRGRGRGRDVVAVRRATIVSPPAALRTSTARLPTLARSLTPTCPTCPHKEVRSDYRLISYNSHTMMLLLREGCAHT
jgi:hypothetical protein